MKFFNLATLQILPHVMTKVMFLWFFMNIAPLFEVYFELNPTQKFILKNKTPGLLWSDNFFATFWFKMAHSALCYLEKTFLWVGAVRYSAYFVLCGEYHLLLYLQLTNLYVNSKQKLSIFVSLRDRTIIRDRTLVYLWH